jgi:hypothetical protein
MCWEETEETVIHEGISQWGTVEGQTDIFCLWADSTWRDLTPDICLGRSIKIYITIAGINKQGIYGKNAT